MWRLLFLILEPNISMVLTSGKVLQFMHLDPITDGDNTHNSTGLVTPDTQLQCAVTDFQHTAGETDHSTSILSSCAVTQFVFNLQVSCDIFTIPLTLRWFEWQ